MGSQPKLSVAQQDLGIKSHFPQFIFRREENIPTWRGVLQPTELSPHYHIRLSYTMPRDPQVWVTAPRLHPEAPHRYPQNGALCLYYPNDAQAASWSPDQHIAMTILPWTALWLAFYEVWLETGKWYGPEAPHRIKASVR